MLALGSFAVVGLPAIGCRHGRRLSTLQPEAWVTLKARPGSAANLGGTERRIRTAFIDSRFAGMTWQPAPTAGGDNA
jgi:hypothetical protein